MPRIELKRLFRNGRLHLPISAASQRQIRQHFRISPGKSASACRFEAIGKLASAGQFHATALSDLGPPAKFVSADEFGQKEPPPVLPTLETEMNTIGHCQWRRKGFYCTFEQKLI